MSQKDSNNCVHFDNNIQRNDFNGNAHLNYDECYENQQENESKGPGSYQLSHLYSCNCGIPEVINKATSGPAYAAKQFRDGYGWAYCKIDNDSKLRNAKNLTNVRCINQLTKRFSLTTPYLGRGMCDTDLEMQIKPGDDTFQNRPCNVLAGKDMTNYHMIPMIDCLKENVQNKNHIIEEEVGWVRSGIPSRQVIRNKDYLEKCGYTYNGKYWNKPN